MPGDLDPIVDTWYRHLDKGPEFVVISVDQVEGTVEIQHFNGDIEEIDMDIWYELQLETIEPPEDWTGPIDDLEHDDLGFDTSDMNKEDWTASDEIQGGE